MAANSNGVPSSFGGTGNTGTATANPGTGFAGANDAPGSTGTGAPTAPTGIGSIPAGATPTNPGSITYSSVPTPAQIPGTAYGIPAFQKIANQKVIDGSMAGATPAVAAKPYDEKQLVQSLADALDVKAPKGETLEAAVANKLADKYGVNVSARGETTTGTGTGQGTVGQIRHNIASLFTSGVDFITHGGVAGVANNEERVAQQRAAIAKMKSPALRDQATAKLNRQIAQGNDQGTPPGQAIPVPAESTKALNQILTQVAQKLGVSGAGPQALEDIAKETGAKYQTPALAAQAGTPQTYAQNFEQFAALWQKNPKSANGQTFQSMWTDNLENMGLLNAQSNTANFGATESTTNTKTGLTTSSAAGQAAPTQDQVFNAYQNFLVDAAQAGQSPLQYQQAAGNPGTATGAAAAALAAGAPSEMYGYVQGVAQEMGVGLTSSQINQISNFYGASATTADDPSSVEDQIKDAVVALYSPPSDPSNPASPNAYGVVNPSGVANTMYVDIQQQALAYQIPISAGQITSMVQNDLQGATVESIYAAADAAEAKAQQTFESQAQGLYPSLASQISQGSTVQQLTAPYLNVAEAITGVPASTMTTDMAQGGVSKWGAFLQGGNNPTASTQTNNSTGAAQAGQPQMMTLDQWKTYLMQNPQYGFQNTQGAKDMGEQLSSAILNEFGRVNTTQSQTPVQSIYQGQSDLSANTA